MYLDSPNKEIEWATGEDDKAAFACGEMQGWRLNMVSQPTVYGRMSSGHKEYLSLLAEERFWLMSDV